MFKFDMQQEVRLVQSGEHGAVIGRAEYAFGNENLYLVRYVASDGRQVEGWQAESSLRDHIQGAGVVSAAAA
jgi:hypothetical protein